MRMRYREMIIRNIRMNCTSMPHWAVLPGKDLDMDFSYDRMFREYAKAQGFTQDDFKIDKKKAVELMKQYHEGDQKDAIFKMYIGLKYYITRCIYKYGSTYLQTRPGDIDAMETSCFFAVQDAMRNYDPERTSPTTYFDFYIRSAIQRFMEAELSRTTSARTEDMGKVKRAIDRLEAAGVAYDSADIATHTGLSIRVTEDRLKLIQMNNAKSYEEHIDEIGEIESRQPSVESQAIASVLHDDIMDVLSCFTEMEQDIVILAYGFYTDHPLSKAAIASYINEKYGMSYTGNQINTILERVQKQIFRSRRFQGFVETSNRRKQVSLSKVSKNRAVPSEMMDEIKECLLEDDEEQTIELGFGKIGKK